MLRAPASALREDGGGASASLDYLKASGFTCTAQSAASAAWAPAVASAPSSQTTFERIERQRPPLKTPALIVGGTFMAAGVGLYAASFSTKSKFEKATTLDDAKAHRSTTNTLVIAASSAFVAGAGMTYVGFMLDSGAGLAWTGRF